MTTRRRSLGLLPTNLKGQKMKLKKELKKRRRKKLMTGRRKRREKQPSQAWKRRNSVSLCRLPPRRRKS